MKTYKKIKTWILLSILLSSVLVGCLSESEEVQGKITGTVITENTIGVIYLFNEENNKVPVDSTVANQGTFSFRQLPKGYYTVLATEKPKALPKASEFPNETYGGLKSGIWVADEEVDVEIIMTKYDTAHIAIQNDSLIVDAYYYNIPMYQDPNSKKWIINFLKQGTVVINLDFKNKETQETESKTYTCDPELLQKLREIDLDTIEGNPKTTCQFKIKNLRTESRSDSIFEYYEVQNNSGKTVNSNTKFKVNSSYTWVNKTLREYDTVVTEIFHKNLKPSDVAVYNGVETSSTWLNGESKTFVVANNRDDLLDRLCNFNGLNPCVGEIFQVRPKFEGITNPSSQLTVTANTFCGVDTSMQISDATPEKGYNIKFKAYAADSGNYSGFGNTFIDTIPFLYEENINPDSLSEIGQLLQEGLDLTANIPTNSNGITLEVFFNGQIFLQQTSDKSTLRSSVRIIHNKPAFMGNFSRYIPVDVETEGPCIMKNRAPMSSSCS